MNNNTTSNILVNKGTSYAFNKMKSVFKSPFFWLIFLGGLLFLMILNNFKDLKYDPDLTFITDHKNIQRKKVKINDSKTYIDIDKDYEEQEEYSDEYNYINQSIKNDDEVEIDFDKFDTNLEMNKEQLCCKILSELYESKFEKERPDWLLNPYTNKPLELDCYNLEYGVALEYNGIQHYKFPNPFHKNENEYIMQRQRDIAKKIMCESKGILFIEVPYYIPIENLKKYIENKIVEKIKKSKIYSKN